MPRQLRTLRFPTSTDGLTLLTVIALLGFTFGSRLYLAQGGTLGLDLGDWVDWSQQLLHGDTHTFYARSQSDYLPGYLYILWLLGKLSMVLHVSHPTDISSPAIQLLFKMPALLADAATVVLIYCTGRRWTGAPLATLAAVSYAFNPGVVYNSARWGQVDSVPAFLMLLALVLVLDERIIVGGVVLALSILVKPTALVLLPPLLVMLAARRPADIFRFGIAGIVTAVIVFWPFVPRNQNLIQFALHSFATTSGRYPMLTINAFNLWAAYQGGVGFMRDSLALFGLSFQLWGMLLVGALVAGVCGLLLIRSRRTLSIDAQDILPALSVVTLGFFILLTRMHERHMLPALPLLALTCTIWPRFWLPYLGLSVTYWLNLRFSYQLLLPPHNVLFTASQVSLLGAFNTGMLALTAMLLAYCLRRTDQSVVAGLVRARVGWRIARAASPGSGG